MRTVVVTDPPRADAGDAEQLGGFGVATVHEALGRVGYLGPELRPAWPGARIGGTAVTVLCWPGDNLMIHVAVEQCRPGDVLVVATNSPSTDGLFGELFATALAHRGVDEICRSFLVEDITDSPAQLRIAFDLVAAGYAQLASTPLDPQEIREELCADSYHRHGLARTLLLTGANPNTGTVEPLGTLRIVLGYAHTTALGMPPLEAMALLTPEAGWQDFTFAGFDVDKVVEGGRTTVAPACRTGLAKAMSVPLCVLLHPVSGGLSSCAPHLCQAPILGHLTVLYRDQGRSSRDHTDTNPPSHAESPRKCRAVSQV